MRICVSAYFLKKSQPQGHEIRSHLAREVEGWCSGVVEGRYGGGPVQIACLGVEPNDCSTQLVATAVKENPPQPTVHLAIIQACFTLSSRVLLVSNLRRSNWKCTVKRFFKSTVMIEATGCEGVATSSAACITLAVKQGMDVKVFSLTLSVEV